LPFQAIISLLLGAILLYKLQISKMKKLFTPYSKAALQLRNHVVMAPMTRSRAIGNVHNDLMATYYKQRSGAGLIITEGTSPSPEGLGYPRIPGVFNDAQVEGWKLVTNAVHEAAPKYSYS
jgi:N-ethylmaleimide reductase